jgi:hypothetical protein
LLGFAVLFCFPYLIIPQFYRNVKYLGWSASVDCYESGFLLGLLCYGFRGKCCYKKGALLQVLKISVTKGMA